MNQSEWREWFRHLQTRFPAVNEEIKSITGEGDLPSRREVLAAWAVSMASCSVADAKNAVDAIHAGSEKKPFRVEDWPGAVANLCRKYAAARRAAAPVYHDGELAVKCLDCDDTGYVRCWSSLAIKALESGDSLAWQLGTVCVPCHCDSGLRHIPQQQRNNAPRYSPLRWCKIDWSEDGNRR
jgi:hypothetical protein